MAYFIVFVACSLREAVFPTSLVDERIFICEAYLSLAFFSTKQVVAFVFEIVVFVQVSSLSMFFTSEECACIAACWFLESALFGKITVLIEFAII